jgi:cytochrome c-type biogenesis protein
LTESFVGPYAVFIAGLVSTLAPSVWPLLPFFAAYFIATVLGRPGSRSRPKTAGLLIEHFLFALGFFFVFVWLGASETLLGQFFFSHQGWFTAAGGAFLILCGLILLRISMPPLAEKILAAALGPFFSAITGAAVAFSWTPCLGPVLGTVLLMGSSHEAVWRSIGLLLIYSAGFAVPFFILSWTLLWPARRIEPAGRLAGFLRKAAGVVFVAGGAVMAAGFVNKITGWMLEFFEPWVDQLIRWGI